MRHIGIMSEQIARRGNPAWRPGVSGNPSGRPKGAAGLAAYIAEQTQDGRELVDRLLAISRNPGSPIREVAAATQALLDRQIGKPVAPSVVTAHVETSSASQQDWSEVPLERRRQLRADIRAALDARVPNPKVLDGEAVALAGAVAIAATSTDEE